MWCGHPRHRPRAGRARRPGHGALASLLLGNRGTKHAPSPEIQCRPSKELSPSPNRRSVALGRTPGRSSSLRAVSPGHPTPRVRGPATLLMQEQWARKLPVARPQRRRGSRNENGDVGRLCPRGEGERAAQPCRQEASAAERKAPDIQRIIAGACQQKETALANWLGNCGSDCHRLLPAGRLPLPQWGSWPCSTH